jgi:hypothetical protein
VVVVGTRSRKKIRSPYMGEVANSQTQVWAFYLVVMTKIKNHRVVYFLNCKGCGNLYTARKIDALFCSNSCFRKYDRIKKHDHYIKREKEYYLKNKEKINEHNKKWAKNNKQIVNTIKKKSKEKRKKESPEKYYLYVKKSIENRKNKGYKKIYSQNLMDGYVRERFKYCIGRYPSDEELEQKRLALKIKRTIKKLKQLSK